MLKLGGGSSSCEAHSRLYTTASRSCNIFLRDQSYKEGIHPDEDGDSELRYNDLLTGQLTFPGADRLNHIQVTVDYPLFLFNVDACCRSMGYWAVSLMIDLTFFFICASRN